ncbi:MAG: hypothetical protein IIV45_18115, partial [Lachnospiraceae bacterium]|nr:hypothetical protein [Lachnospiraceae bacterium]
ADIVIDEEEVPLASGDAEETMDIEDEDVPLAAGSNQFMYWILLMLLVVCAISGIVFVQYRKKAVDIHKKK